MTVGSAGATGSATSAPQQLPAQEVPVQAPAQQAPAQQAPAQQAPAQQAPPGDDAWTATELTQVRADLAGQATELRREIGDAETAAENLSKAGPEGPGDEADAGSKTFERDHEMSLANNSRDLLQQIERALARLDDGSYGSCESCRAAIPKPRLQAFPRATLCVACKQREERR